MTHRLAPPRTRKAVAVTLGALAACLAILWLGDPSEPDRIVAPVTSGPPAVEASIATTAPETAGPIGPESARPASDARSGSVPAIENLAPLGVAPRPVVSGELVVGLGPVPIEVARDALAAHGFEPLELAPSLGALRVSIPHGWSVAVGLEHLGALVDDGVVPDVLAAPNAVAWAASGEGNVNPWAWTAADAEMAIEAEARENSPQGQARKAQIAAQAVGYPMVAVLDTGIACRSAMLARGPFVSVRAFAAIDCQQGWNYIHDDDQPLDDNVHGSHVAATLVAAAGNQARLMPIKVLDWQAIGTEYDVAQGIARAVEDGAHIVNLSLTFGGGYVPSQLMIDAIDVAAAAEVILVGASGNTASPTVAHPAAFEAVVAVGAIVDTETVAPYSNSGASLDLVAIGGGIPADRFGVAADVFVPQMPTRTERFLMSGTSVAAAQVSGQMATMLAEVGADATVEVERAVLMTPRPLAGAAFDTQWGMGELDPEHAVRAIEDARAEILLEELHKAGDRPSVYPAVFIETVDVDAVRGVAVIEAMDAERQPMAGAVVFGDWLGSAPGEARCVTDDYGRCVVETAIIEPGLESPLFALIVHRIVPQGGSAQPVNPGSRVDEVGGSDLADAMATLRLYLPIADQTKADLALLSLTDPVTGRRLYCQAMACAGDVPAGSHPEDIFQVLWTPVLTVTRLAAVVPPADSLLAGRTLAETFVSRRLGRGFEGSGLTLAFDGNFYDALAQAYGDAVYLDDDGLQLGSDGAHGPLLWVNDWDAPTLAEGVGMMISGFVIGGRSFGAAAMFYEQRAGGVGMMISGFMVGVTDRRDFWDLNAFDYGPSWDGFGVGMMISGFSPSPLLDLPYFNPPLPNLPDPGVTVPSFP